MKQSTGASFIGFEKEQAKSERPFIGTWEETPKFCQDNEYIRTGYRINFRTVPQILKSLFMIHNETVNIWSHLVGAIAFIAFLVFALVNVKTFLSFINVGTVKAGLESGFDQTSGRLAK